MTQTIMGSLLVAVLLSCRAAMAMQMGSRKAKAHETLERSSAKAHTAMFRDEGDLPDALDDGIDEVKAWAKRRIKMGEEHFEATNFKRLESPVDWGDSIVYHVQADRFNNGDFDNDITNVDTTQAWDLKVGQFTNVPIWRHGGDFKGIKDRIPYLKDLGVDTLWVTPVLQHDGSYHAYCATDPSTTDPGFGSPQEFRDLVQECHHNGIRFVLDIVINHLCDPETGYIRAPEHAKCPQALWDNHWEGKNFSEKIQGDLWFGKNFFPPFKSQEFFSRCGALEYEEMSDEKAPSVFGDFRDGMFDYNTRNPNFHEIYTDLMKFWIGYADIDAYRLDAAKHVTEDFVAYFSTEMRDYARSIGKDNFLIIGEVATLQPEWQAVRLGRMLSNPQNPDEHDKYMPKGLTRVMKQMKSKYLANKKFPMPGLNAVYNFMMSGTARDLVLGWRTGKEFEDYLHGKKYWMVMEQLTDLVGKMPDLVPHSQLWTALELHDWPRILSDFPGDHVKSELSVTWLLTGAGTPVIYAGFEQGFNGHCPHFDTLNDTWNKGIGSFCGSGYVNMRVDAPKRQDMFLGGPWRLGSAVPEVNALGYVGVPQSIASPYWKDDPYLARNHTVYRMSRALANLRRSCPVLRHGNFTMRHWVDKPLALFAYSRFLKPESYYSTYGTEMVVLINPQNDTQIRRLDLETDINREPGQRYRNVFNTAEVGWVEKDKNGQAYLHLGGADNKGLTVYGGTAMIFAHEENLKEFDPQLGVALCRGDFNSTATD